MVTVLFWIIFGGLAGWISAMINEETSIRRTVAYIMLGIVGALLGGALMYAINNSADLRIDISNLVLPVLGSVVALIAATFLIKQSQ